MTITRLRTVAVGLLSAALLSVPVAQATALPGPAARPAPGPTITIDCGAGLMSRSLSSFRPTADRHGVGPSTWQPLWSRSGGRALPFPDPGEPSTPAGRPVPLSGTGLPLRALGG